jgi:hypothetical protein
MDRTLYALVAEDFDHVAKVIKDCIKDFLGTSNFFSTYGTSYDSLAAKITSGVQLFGPLASFLKR